MPAYKLDPDWVMTYLDVQEEKMHADLSAEQTEKIMNKIREFTLSIMYKQARRYIVYLESDEETVETKQTHVQKTRL